MGHFFSNTDSGAPARHSRSEFLRVESKSLHFTKGPNVILECILEGFQAMKGSVVLCKTYDTLSSNLGSIAVCSFQRF